MKTTLNPEVEETPDDFDFELPHFTEAEAGQAWLDSLPREEAEVDERLKKRVTVTMNLRQLHRAWQDYTLGQSGLATISTNRYQRNSGQGTHEVSRPIGLVGLLRDSTSR